MKFCLVAHTTLSHHLVPPITRASSILQRNPKVYGPANALREDSSCWNSEGNNDDDDSHWFRLDFKRRVQPTTAALQFQAGFCVAGGRLEYQTAGDDDAWHTALDDDVEWQDDHALQTVALRPDICCTSLRFVLEDCTDFYGRVILYQVKVWGKEVNQQGE